MDGNPGPLDVFEAPLDPVVGNRQRLSRIVAWRKKPSPVSHDVVIRPAFSDVGVETHEHMQMVIHHREPADRCGRDKGDAEGWRVKKTAVFLTGRVARRLVPRKPTSIRCDGFLYSSGKGVEDDH